MITIKLLGGARKSFGTDLISAELDKKTIANLIDYLVSIKPKNTPELDVNNMLVAINGVDSSALQGFQTILHASDVVSIIPIVHGGSLKNRFKVGNYTLELFFILHKKNQNYSFLNLIRNKFRDLIMEGISWRCILGPSHVRKIVSQSITARKYGLLLSKKIHTDILLRFAATTQISDAIKKVGIDGDEFVLVAVGTKKSLRSLRSYLGPYLTNEPDYNKNAKYISELFKITKKHQNAVLSKSPLEDILVEKAAILITK